MSDPVTAGFAIFTAVTGVASIVQQRKAARVQRRQNKVANRIAANKRIRDIKRAIALSRIRRAELQSAGFQLGVAGGTPTLGAVGGAQSDVASQIGESNVQFTGQQVIASLSDRISSLQSSAQTFAGIQQLSGMFTGGPGSVGAQNRAAVAGLFP